MSYFISHSVERSGGHCKYREYVVNVETDGDWPEEGNNPGLNRIQLWGTDALLALLILLTSVMATVQAPVPDTYDLVRYISMSYINSLFAHHYRVSIAGRACSYSSNFSLQ